MYPHCSKTVSDMEGLCKKYWKRMDEIDKSNDHVVQKDLEQREAITTFVKEALHLLIFGES